MKYGTKERQRIDLTLAVFAPYIDSNPYFDIIYSDATGYLQITREKAYGDTIATPIKSCPDLLEMMFDEYVDDVIEPNMPNRDDSPKLSDKEKEETCRRVSAAIAMLEEHKNYCLMALQGYLKHYNDKFEDREKELYFEED